MPPSFTLFEAARGEGVWGFPPVGRGAIYLPGYLKTIREAAPLCYNPPMVETVVIKFPCPYCRIRLEVPALRKNVALSVLREMKQHLSASSGCHGAAVAAGDLRLPEPFSGRSPRRPRAQRIGWRGGNTPGNRLS